MDFEVAAVTLLNFLRNNNILLASTQINHLRIMLSIFAQEILSTDEYEHLINSLRENEYIDKRKESLNLSRQGIALADALGETVLGQTSLSRLNEIAQNYSKDKNYIHQLTEQLKQLQEIKEEKVKDVDSSLVQAVGILLKIHYKTTQLYCSRFLLNQEIMRNQDGLERMINLEAWRYYERENYPILTRRDGNVLEIIGFAPVPLFSISGQELQPSAIEDVDRESVYEFNTFLGSIFMKSNLEELGYLSSRSRGKTFINYADRETKEANVGLLSESGSLHLEMLDLDDANVFIWIESYTSASKLVIDYLRENDIAEAGEILESLSNLILRNIPFGSELKNLKAIQLGQDITNTKVPSMNQTYYDFWSQKYGIELKESVQPILVVEVNNQDFHYPAETIFIDRYSLKKIYGGTLKRQTLPLSPHERFTKVKDISNWINQQQTNPLSEYVDISIKRYVPTVEELSTIGAFEKAVRVSPPMLEFSNGKITLDPWDVFQNPEIIPSCGRKNIFLTHLILPENISDKKDNLIKELQKMFKKYGFGSIKQSTNIKIITYEKAVGVQGLESKLRDLQEINDNNPNLAIAIIPEADNNFYYSLKRLLPRNTRVPLQCITLPSFEEIMNKNFRGFPILCLKILIKTLERGEAIWNLSNNAGLLSQDTLFVGIGFSRYPRERRVSKCAAVLHDARGGRVSWNIFSTTQERTITKQWFDNLLRRIQDSVEKENPSRVVFYRTGNLTERENEEIRKSIDGFDFLSPIKVSFVTVLDKHNSRLYLYHKEKKKTQNLPTGYAVIINDREAILSTSNFDERELRKGTVVPIGLKLEFGDDEIQDIVSEYHDLTYLNWRAPRTTAKHPLVLTIANRFAELTREGVIVESMFYLDL